MRDIDAITRDLAQIQDDLLALDSDDFEERYRLHVRRDGLREEADTHQAQHDDARPSDEINAEIRSLRAKVRRLIERSVGLMSGKGGNNQAPVSGALVELALRAKRQSQAEVSKSLARINQLEGVLSTRASEGDSDQRRPRKA